MSMRTKEAIFNAALLRCGQKGTGTSSSIVQALEANYDEIVRSAFESSDGNLPFGRSMVELTSRSPGTLGFEDAYQLPNETLHVYEVYVGGCPSSDSLHPWDVDGATNELLIDGDGAKIEAAIVVRGREASWSSTFAEGIQRRLEAVIKDFLEEGQEALYKEQEADAKFMVAGVNASKGRSNNRVFKQGGGRLSRSRTLPSR